MEYNIFLLGFFEDISDEDIFKNDIEIKEIAVEEWGKILKVKTNLSAAEVFEIYMQLLDCAIMVMTHIPFNDIYTSIDITNSDEDDLISPEIFKGLTSININLDERPINDDFIKKWTDIAATENVTISNYPYTTEEDNIISDLTPKNKNKLMNKLINKFTQDGKLSDEDQELLRKLSE